MALTKFLSGKSDPKITNKRDEEIKNCQTLEEIFEILKKYHNTGKKLGMIDKKLIETQMIPRLDTIIKALGL